MYYLKLIKSYKQKILSKFAKIFLTQSCRLDLFYRLINSKNNLKENLSSYRNIYIDVSVIAKHNSKTGIQRVVKEIIREFIKDKDISYKVRFIASSKRTGYKEVTLIDIENLVFSNTPINYFKEVELSKYDIFLGLDFCPTILPCHFFTLLSWRFKGTAFAWVIHDILPLQHPNWFTENTQNNFLPWLNMVLLLADINFCVSNTVKNSILDLCREINFEPNLTKIRLGANFSVPLKKYSNSQKQIQLIADSYVLIVGTLEPRKGHMDIIRVFNYLWLKKLTSINLVIVGKYGWKSESLISEIEYNQFYNQKLFWVKDLEDEGLDKYYTGCLGVIIPSYAEGYGLPIAEALFYNKSVLARDISVFRENFSYSNYITFFAANNEHITNSIMSWLNDLNKPIYTSFKEQNYIMDTWEVSKDDILRKIVKE